MEGFAVGAGQLSGEFAGARLGTGQGRWRIAHELIELDVHSLDTCLGDSAFKGSGLFENLDPDPTAFDHHPTLMEVVSNRHFRSDGRGSFLDPLDRVATPLFQIEAKEAAGLEPLGTIEV